MKTAERRAGRRRRLPTIRAALAVIVAAVLLAGADVQPRAAALVGGALVAGLFLRLLATSELDERPGPFARFLEGPTHHAPAGTDVVAVERRLELATSTAGDAHRLFRPAVSAIAEEWLRSRHGIGLDDPAAGELLPREVWALARPGQERPAEPHAHGPSAREVAGIIDQLEAMT